MRTIIRCVTVVLLRRGRQRTSLTSQKHELAVLALLPSTASLSQSRSWSVCLLQHHRPRCPGHNPFDCDGLSTLQKDKWMTHLSTDSCHRCPVMLSSGPFSCAYKRRLEQPQPHPHHRASRLYHANNPQPYLSEYPSHKETCPSCVLFCTWSPVGGVVGVSDLTDRPKENIEHAPGMVREAAMFSRFYSHSVHAW